MVKRNGDLTAREMEALIVSLETKVQALRETLGTALSWMAGSANSPLRRDEVIELLKTLDKGWPV